MRCKKSTRQSITLNCSGTNLFRKRARRLKRISSPTKPAKPVFLNGSPRNETCAIWKPWRNNTSLIITRRSLNSKRWSALISIFFPQRKRRKQNEIDHAETVRAHGALDRPRVLKIEPDDEATGCRLLHLHDAPIGACGSAGQMSDLWDGSCIGDEENGFTVSVRVFGRRRNARHGRNAGNARNAKRQADERCAIARICRPGRAAATNRRQLRDSEARAVASHDSRGRNGGNRYAETLGVRCARRWLCERTVCPVRGTSCRKRRAPDVDLQPGLVHD